MQNRAYRTILALNPLTGEKELYPKMGVKKLDEVHKTQLMMFLFKNKSLFGLHNTELRTRSHGAEAASDPNWRKEHARLQGRYQGYQIFNKLPLMTRNEKKLSVFKRQMTAHFLSKRN